MLNKLNIFRAAFIALIFLWGRICFAQAQAPAPTPAASPSPPAAASPSSPTLSDLLHLAVQNQPTLHEGTASVNQEQGLEVETRSAFYPQIVFDNSWERANAREAAFGASQAFNLYDSEFDLSQLIFNFGMTADQVMASHYDVLQAKQNYNATYEQVLLNVYSAYYTLLADREVVRVNLESVRDLKNHLAQARGFFAAGTQPLIDVTQAEVNLSSGQLSLVQAQNSYADQKTTLATAVGIPGLPLDNVQGTLGYTGYPIALSDALNLAFGNRPDLKALMDQEEAAKSTLSAATKLYYPTINGTAGYGWVGGNFPPNSNVWSFGITLDVPVFNGFLTAGEIQVAKAQLDNDVAQVDNLKLSIRESVEEAYLNLQAAKTSLDEANVGLRYARENYALAEGQYRVGTANYIQYDDAEVSLVQAETNQIQALANYNIAVATLKQSMGILEVTQ